MALQVLESTIQADSPGFASSVDLGGGRIPYTRMVAALVKDLETPTLNMLHAAVGISGEAGELIDAIKKHWVYGKPLDLENVIEELGDLEFYMAALRMTIEVTRSQVLQHNAIKLSKRYGSSYSDAAAVARADKEPGKEVEVQYNHAAGTAINLPMAAIAATDDMFAVTATGQGLLDQPVPEFDSPLDQHRP